jgi:hypothetical protein
VRGYLEIKELKEISVWILGILYAGKFAQWPVLIHVAVLILSCLQRIWGFIRQINIIRCFRDQISVFLTSSWNDGLTEHTRKVNLACYITCVKCCEFSGERIFYALNYSLQINPQRIFLRSTCFFFSFIVHVCKSPI